MNAVREKELERRVKILERQVRDLLVCLGKTDADLEQMEYERAIEYMAEHGDPALINKYLEKVNKREGAGLKTVQTLERLNA